MAPALRFAALALAGLFMVGGRAVVFAAADNKPPVISKAEMRDFDGDGKADRVDIYFNEKIRCPRTSGEDSPFVVDGYRITEMKKTENRRLVTLILKEKSKADPLAHPDIDYVPHAVPESSACKDATGNAATRQTFTRTVPWDPNAVLTLEIKAVYTGSGDAEKLICSGAFLKSGVVTTAGTIDQKFTRADTCKVTFKNVAIFGQAFRILISGAVVLPVGGCKTFTAAEPISDIKIELSEKGFTRCGVLP